jgi:hypothetical protein
MTDTKSNKNLTKDTLKNSILPMFVSILVLGVFILIYFLEISGLNLLPFIKEPISISINPSDVVVGMLIYLKTSIDFALFIGLLMTKYPGLKNRFAIEIGTGVGNTLGTLVVLAIWVFFKEISWLLGLMILIASLVLFEMAHGSLEHLDQTEEDTKDQVDVAPWQHTVAGYIKAFLKPILFVISPVVSKILPSMSVKEDSLSLKKSFFGLFFMAMSVPFILGLDDFAGYVPAFKVVNVFGFGVGIFAGHTILNILLFLNPKATIRIIKNPNIAILGALAFIGLACYGLYETAKIFLGVHH